MDNSLLAEFQALTAQLSSTSPDDSVEFLLEQMEPDSAKSLKLCAIPHQIDTDVLQVLDPSLTAEQAAERCDEFAELAIMTFNPDGMALHDKARRQLFEQWLGPPTHPDFPAASGRLVTFFDAKAEATTSAGEVEILRIASMFHLLGADQSAGFDAFQRLCRQRRREFRLDACENLITRVHEYDPVLTPEHRQWLSYHEGKLAADRCQWDRAEEIFKQILNTQPLEPMLEITTTNRLGMIRDEKRDYYGAIDYYQKALDLARAIKDDSRFVHRILADLGAAQRDIGNLDEAKELLIQSIELAKQYDDASGVAAGHNSLGMLYRKEQEPVKAIKAYESSLKHLDQCGDVLRRAQVFNNLGIVHREQGEWKKSKEYFEESSDIARRAGDSIGQAKSLNNLMGIYRNLNENTKAIDAALQSIKLFEEAHDIFNAALTKRNLGRLYRRMKKRDEALQAFQEAIDAFERCKAIDETVETRRDLAHLQDKHNNLAFWIVVLLLLLALLFFVYIMVSEL